MKLKLFIAFFAGTICTAKAQTAFTGIGIFKIGADTTVVYNYAKEKNLKPIDVSTKADFRKYKAKDGVAYFLRLHDSKKKETKIFEVGDCPLAKSYYLSNYTVAGITLKNVALLFFQNRLIKLDADYSTEVFEALASKYGEQEISSEDEIVSCVSPTTGLKRELVAKNFTRKQKHGKIFINGKIWESYNSKCEKSTLSFFFYNEYNKEYNDCKIAATIAPTNESLKDF